MAEPKQEATGETDPSDNAQEDNAILSFTIKDQAGSEMHFKVRKNTPFAKVFAAYAAKKSLAENTVKLLFDNIRVNAKDTPASLEMEDGDTIDAYMEQLGGC